MVSVFPYLSTFIYAVAFYLWDKTFSNENHKDIDANHSRPKTHFDFYLEKYNRSYNATEYEIRYAYFMANLEELLILNDGSDSARYGLNKFADMARLEFEEKMTMRGMFKNEECKKTAKHKTCVDDYYGYEIVNNNSIPPAFDWRKRGIVGPVLDQGNCQACWAFSVAGVMETMAAMQNNGKFTRLSIQELIDIEDSHCKLGNPVKIINTLCNDRNLTVTTEADYPLTLKEESLRLPAPTKGWQLSRIDVECDMDSKRIMDLIANHGPVVAAINGYALHLYLDGVIRWHCQSKWTALNHVVQIIGYDTTAEVPHFILRNSWGTDYGEDGYVKVSIDNFTCGVGRQIIYFDVYHHVVKDPFDAFD